MPHQTAVTVRARVAAGRGDALARLLSEMGEQGAADNDTLPIAELPGVHFARLFVLDDAVDLDGEPLPSALFYMADVDDTGERHLRDLATVGGSGVDAVFAHCEGYPDAPDVRERLAWLRDHTLEPAARYVHSVGRSVDQVRQEARLREGIQTFLDARDAVPAGLSAVEAHGRIRSFVARRDDLRWAGARARPPGLRFRLREKVHLVAVPLAGLVLLPVLVPVALVLLVLVRLAERRDVPESGPPSREQAAALERLEDHVAQNPFTAVGYVKPGRLRRLVMRGVLLGLDYADRHVYNRDNLRGVRTIHFARWLPIDDGRRLIFCSSYDGTLESYMDDFIDRLAWGLNAVFSNGVGYPSTRWLVLRGAKDEVAFKHYLRRHQVPNLVWYSAYDSLPARNIDTNQRLRADLTRVGDEQEAAKWLELV
jgi:hypothetical protein